MWESIINFFQNQEVIEIVVVLIFYVLLLILSECFAYIYSRKKVIESNNIRSTLNVGRWIGKAENVILLTLMLLKAYTALGLVLAAKGLIRWEGLRKEPYFIILGTVVNFACSVAIGGILLWIIKNGYYMAGLIIGFVGIILGVVFLLIIKLINRSKKRKKEE